MLFIEDITAKDQAYNNIRSAKDPYAQRAKELTETLWQRYERHADPNFKTEIQSHFSERFWEMYLAISLEEAGLEIRCPKPGPDILVTHENKKIWFEAIAPTDGEPGKPDSVPPVVIGKAGDVPDKEVMLRIRSAIEEKYRNKYWNYRAKGIVSEEDIYVIAVNGCQMYYALMELTVPRIVRVVFGVGDLQLVLNKKTLEIQERRYTEMPEIAKTSGSSVSTSIFMEDDYNYLSAVLYSNIAAWRAPSSVGSDYVLVHNPVSINPLQRGLIKLGKEYSTIDNGDSYSLHVQEWN